MAGVELRVDEWGIDVCFASVQKAWGLPPGFSLCSVSPRALKRSYDKSLKGYYLDFAVFHEFHKKSQTPTTPSIPHMFALRVSLKRIKSEGLDNRFQRHKDLSRYVKNWGNGHFSLFSADGFHSITLSCFKTPQGFKTDNMIKELKKRGYLISGGYGSFKGKTFRIAHMGDMTLNDLRELTREIDTIIKEHK
jgi:aspartate aminotransferase-like enzyme